MRRLLLALSLVACHDGPVPPPAAPTVAAARAALDDAALALTRANQQLWRLGARDVVSPVYLDTLTPPTYVRQERR